VRSIQFSYGVGFTCVVSFVSYSSKIMTDIRKIFRNSGSMSLVSLL